MSNFVPASLLCDFYKTSHYGAYPQGTTKIYSTFTPRSNKYMPQAKEGAVVFGIQSFVMKYLVDFFNENFFGRSEEEIVNEYERVMKHSLGIQNPNSSHIVALHKLGYLPIEVRALEEGTVVPMQVPFLTIENTVDEFFWVTNYLETILSSEIWFPVTSATHSYYVRKMLDKYAMQTVGHTNDVPFQAHDFSFRGQTSLDSAMLSGAGHLLSFVGTDTIPAIHFLEHYYGANIENELVGASIPATEHSVMTALTPTDSNRDEREAYKQLITETFPSGLVSLVSDSYDFWKVIGETIPSLKEEIMNRDGKVVIRPDSGNPYDIIVGLPYYKINKHISKLSDKELKEIALEVYEKKMYVRIENFEDNDMPTDSWGIDFYIIDSKKNVCPCTANIYELGFDWEREAFDYEVEIYDYDSYRGIPSYKEVLGLIEALWETFGGTVSEQGYKVLDSHIGAIYGDSITHELAEKICKGLMDKGFATTNVVFGFGSYSFTFKTRDSLGMAMKATYAEINGKPVMLQKDPKTDSGKKSQRGKVLIMRDNVTNKLVLIDGLSNHPQDEDAIEVESLLKPVFRDGKLLRTQTLSDIRAKLHN